MLGSFRRSLLGRRLYVELRYYSDRLFCLSCLMRLKRPNSNEAGGILLRWAPIRRYHFTAGKSCGAVQRLGFECQKSAKHNGFLHNTDHPCDTLIAASREKCPSHRNFLRSRAPILDPLVFFYNVIRCDRTVINSYWATTFLSYLQVFVSSLVATSIYLLAPILLVEGRVRQRNF